MAAILVFDDLAAHSAGLRRKQRGIRRVAAPPVPHLEFWNFLLSTAAIGHF